ncbi:T-box-containing protein TBXT-like isoform X2 [Varroa jacobsoni]|uniref:T-box-containing protein TBXT-like isoform X2 n=1 Tax=Varroa jacobsoni TaxID=62625 RepID=UPI000BF682F8|nr:T-box-containing protein TBXT-like isoform X2 [Varroa jacobsoni]
MEFTLQLGRTLAKLFNAAILLRMFPVIRVQLSGLEPSARYSIRLELTQIGRNRYKFHGTEWVTSGKGEAASSQCGFHHQDSPNTGAFWMKGPVAFNKAKLTNKPTADPRYIVLNSLHVYEPRVVITREDVESFSDTPLSHHVVCSPSTAAVPSVHLGEWSFPLRETQFVAVTAYQNERVTQLKVRHNPFAKAFLDSRNGDGQMLGSASKSTVPVAKQSRQVQQLHLQQQQHHPQQQPEYLMQTQQQGPNLQPQHHLQMFHTSDSGPFQRGHLSHNGDLSPSGPSRTAGDMRGSISSLLPSTSSEVSSPFYSNPVPSDYWKNEAYRIFAPPSAGLVRSSEHPEEGTAGFIGSQTSMGSIPTTGETGSHTIEASHTEAAPSPPSPVPQMPIPFLPSSSFGFPYIHFVDNCEPPPPSQDLEQL